MDKQGMDRQDDPLAYVIWRSVEETGALTFEEANIAAAAVRSFMGSNEVVERMARASFSFRHQGGIADPERTWDAPEKSEHPLYWQQKMEHNHPHYRAMARAALSAAIG